jgi:3-dehydroquinate synthase
VAGLLDAETNERIVQLLSTLGFRLYDPALELRDREGQLRVLEGLREFQEHLGGELTVSLLERAGRARDVHEMDAARVARCIRWLTERYRDAA